MNIFVIMEFNDDKLDRVYQHLIKTPLEEANHNVSRADELSSQDMLGTVMRQIHDDDIVIADLKKFNPNVLYELGIAHTLGKPTVPILQDTEEIPWNLHNLRIFRYSREVGETEKLTKHIQHMIALAETGIVDEFYNPVAKYVQDRNSDPTSRPSSAKDDGEDRVQEADDGKLGILDGTVVAEESLDEIERIIRETTNHFRVLEERARSLSIESENLSALPPQKGQNRKKLEIAERFALDMNAFSENIAAIVPNMENSWQMLGTGTGAYLSNRKIVNAFEFHEIAALIESFVSTQQELVDTITEYETFRSTMARNMGLSNATNKALKNVDKVIKSLTDSLSSGDKVLTRLIRTARDMRNRFAHGIGYIR